MPEGPEIRRAADRVGDVLAGRLIDDIEFGHDHLRRFEPTLTGQEVVDVTSRAKAILIRFAHGFTIYSHNQLYGRWYVRRRDSYPKTGRQLRLALHTDRHSALLYSASDIDVLREEELRHHPFLRRLGPDILDPSTSPRDVHARLDDPRFRRRRLGALLLDQSFLSGVGNYLRSEILFEAGVAPELRPVDLETHEAEELARAALELARRSYDTGGITDDPEDARRLMSEGAPRREVRHFIFGRAGRACRRCDATIAREDQGGRRVYVCSGCQRRRDAASKAGNVT